MPRAHPGLTRIHFNPTDPCHSEGSMPIVWLSTRSPVSIEMFTSRFLDRTHTSRRATPMNRRNPRRSRRTRALILDQLESRQLLSTVALPMHGPMLEHHHHGMRMHHAAAVGPVHSGHHGGADPAATVTASAASTTFNVVKQFNNASF